MATFIVLEPSDGNPDRVAFIPEDFAWGALVFTFLWALWQRMWVVAVVILAAFAGLAVLVKLEAFDGAFAALLYVAGAILFGFEARSLKKKALERAGFRRTGLIQASRREAAELAYFAGRASAPPPRSGPKPQHVPDDTLGIFGNV